MTSEPTPTGSSYLTRSIELLWGTKNRPTRGPKPSLSLDRIVDTGIAVADADGLEALSMRRVARELGVGTMSLYRHVPGKAELLVLMLDRVSDPTEEAKEAAGLDWRGVLEVNARSSWRRYLAHPWLLQVNWTRPVFGPNTLACVEYVIAGTTSMGLSDQERVHVLVTLDSFVTGLARLYVQYSRAAEETGLSDDEFWAQQYPVLERAMASGNYPATAALAEDSFNGSWEESFEFGLARILDGLQALVDARRR